MTPYPCTYRMPALGMRARVARLESALLMVPQVDIPINHHFAPGMYAREMFVPAGTAITGATHKTENLAVLSKGRMRIVDGETIKEISAPALLRCMPGQKNAAVALEDCVWTNFFPTDETDPERLVGLLTESKASDLIGGSDNKQLAANRAKELES